MTQKLDWKKRWIIIITGIVIMMLGQGNLFQIIVGTTIALIGIYYGTKDWLLAYFRKMLGRIIDKINKAPFTSFLMKVFWWPFIT